MAAKIALDPEVAQFRSTNFAQFVRANGTNFPVSGLAFDTALDEEAYWKFDAVDFTGSPVLYLEWYAATANTGDVVWGVAMGAITPDTDTQDVETKALAAESTVTDTHLGTVVKRIHKCNITIANTDSLASDDIVWIRIRRLGFTSGSDTMAGDAILTLAQLRYS